MLEIVSNALYSSKMLPTSQVDGRVLRPLRCEPWLIVVVMPYPWNRARTATTNGALPGWCNCIPFRQRWETTNKATSYYRFVQRRRVGKHTPEDGGLRDQSSVLLQDMPENSPAPDPTLVAGAAQNGQRGLARAQQAQMGGNQGHAEGLGGCRVRHGRRGARTRRHGCHHTTNIMYRHKRRATVPAPQTAVP